MNRRDQVGVEAGSAVGAVPADTDSSRRGVRVGGDREFRRRHVKTADGVTLNVVEAGRRGGPSILFVHGISQSWRSWIRQLSDSALRAQYRLVALDLRGHGESEGAHGAVDADGVSFSPLPDTKYAGADHESTAQCWANDLSAVIRELDLTRPTVVGWSYGGFVLQHYLFKHRGLGDAGRAMFVGSCPVLLPAGSGDGGADRVFSPATGVALAASLPFNLFSQPVQTNTDVGIASALTQFVELCFSDGVEGRPRPQIAEIQGAVAYNLLTPPSVRLCMVTRTFDYRPFFRDLPADVREKMRAVLPLCDAVVSVQNSARHWREAGLAVHEVPSEGHLYFYRNASQFNSELAAFAARG